MNATDKQTAADALLSRLQKARHKYYLKACQTGTAITTSRICVDCGASTDDEYYMVDDEVWPIGADDGQLCIGCLECHLSRRLTAADFTDAPVNWLELDTPRSERLRDRLAAKQ